MFLAWFVVFGGEVFGPLLYRQSQDQICQSFISDCPRDELRFQQFLYGEEAQRVSFNFTNRQLTGEPVLPLASYGLFWNKVEGVFHTINFPPLGFKPPDYYQASRMDEVHAALASLSARKIMPDVPYRKQFHIAFYQEDRLVVYTFTRQEAKLALKNLFQALVVPLNSFDLE